MADDVQIQIGATIEGLKKAIEQSNELVESFKEKVTHAFEIVGIALTIEALKKFVESMAELGLQTERTAAIMGLTTEQVGVMSGVAKLTGTSLESLTLGIERFSLNVQHSTRDALNPQAQALQVLGLRAKDLIGIPTDQYILKLAEAVSKFNPSLNLTNAIMQVGGRGIAQIIPYLRLGADGFHEFEEEVKKTGATLTKAQTESFAKTHESLTLLGLAMEGVGIKIFDVFAPSIKRAADEVRRFIEGLDEADIRSAVIRIGEIMIDLGVKIAQFFITVREIVKDATAWFQNLIAPAEEGSNLIGKLVNNMIHFADPLRALSSESGKGFIGPIATEAAIAAGKMEVAGEQWKEAMRNFLAPVLPVLSLKSIHDAVFGALDVKPINIAAREQLSEYLATVKSTFAQLKTEYTEEARTHVITEYEKWKLIVAAATDAMAKIKGKTKEEKAAFEELNRELIKANGEMVLSLEKGFDQLSNSILSSWNSNLRGLLEGTETWSSAMKKTFEDMVIKLIEMVESLIVKMLELYAIEAITGTTEFSSASGGIFGSAVRSTFKLDKGAWEVGKTYGFPSYQTGVSSVPRTQLAVLHQGEMVVPAGPAQAIRDSVTGGGGTSVTLNIHAMDAGSFDYFLRSGGGNRIASFVAKAWQMNPSGRPAYTG